MSGIVAILNTDGAPCDAGRLRELTQALVFRGPDGVGIEVREEAGLGAALFWTMERATPEAQPLSLDGEVWIISDGRIDDRAALIAELREVGRPARAAGPDIELILHAYLAWGPHCVDRLLGDFAFVVWDGPNRALFAARDHFGAKPLFYAWVGRLLIVSNTLSCIRRHPEVPSEVNEAAIGDFLLFGQILFPAISAFRHIQRLPAAHRLRCCNGELRVERYWQVPKYEEPLRLKRGEVIDRFREVLGSAVSDRLRGQVGAIELSGGVDSTCVAAMVFDLKRSNATNVSLTAWTYDTRPLIPGDREYDLARLTASVLSIPHVRWPFEHYALFRHANGQLVVPQPEPRDLGYLAVNLEFRRAIAASSRILLTGQGGDGAFLGEGLTVGELLRPDRCSTIAVDAVTYALRRRSLPPLGVRTGLKRLAGISRHSAPPFPSWIEPEFARRQSLEERWHHLWSAPPAAATTTVRPSATNLLLCDPWSTILEDYDTQRTGARLDVRHPILDLRVINFLLQVPAIPWFWHKDLPRRACLGLLPRTIRNRRKTPLAGHPVCAALERGDRLPGNWQYHSAVNSYVRCKHLADLPESVSKFDHVHRTMVTYPVSLSLWLQTL